MFDLFLLGLLYHIGPVNLANYISPHYIFGYFLYRNRELVLHNAVNMTRITSHYASEYLYENIKNCLKNYIFRDNCKIETIEC